jgi:hypothetical protein
VKKTLFWGAAPCSLVEVYRRFRGRVPAASIIRTMSKPRARNRFEMGTGWTRQNLGRTNGEEDEDQVRAREPMGEGRTTAWPKGGDKSLPYLKPIPRARLTHRPDDEAASTSETSVNFCETTRRSIPEDSYLHARRRENLKFHLPQRLMRWKRT